MQAQTTTVQFQFKTVFNVKVQQFMPTTTQQSVVPQQSPILILLPALGVAVKKYSQFIECLNSQGYSVVAADYPGCGDNRPMVSRGKDYNYADLLDLFLPELIQVAHAVSQQQPVLLGHSLGGHLATLFAQQHPYAVIGIATGNIHYKNWDFKGQLNLLRAVVLFRPLIAALGYFPGDKIGFGKKEAAGLMKDWCKTVLTGRYSHIQQIKGKAANKNLFIHFEGDEWAPRLSTEKLGELFQQPHVISLSLDASIKGNRHSIWIKWPETVVQQINAFMQKQAQ